MNEKISPTPKSGYTLPETLAEALEVIDHLRGELAKVCVAVGRSKDGTGYDVDWYELHKDIGRGTQSEKRAPVHTYETGVTDPDEHDWHYGLYPEEGTDGRKLVTLEQDGMLWIGIRMWESSLRRWVNNGEPLNEKVIAWKDLPHPAEQSVRQRSSNMSEHSDKNDETRRAAAQEALEGQPAYLGDKQCTGRYPVPGPRTEPFEVTYRCSRPDGHEGEHGDGTTRDSSFGDGERKWQPMETAPKNGHPIEDTLILTEDRHGNRHIYLCHWACGGGEDQPPFGPAWFYTLGDRFVELTEKPIGWLPTPASRHGEIAPTAYSATEMLKPLAGLKEARDAAERKFLWAAGSPFSLDIWKDRDAQVADLRKAFLDADDAYRAAVCTPPEAAPRVGLPLLYNLVCLWCQKKDDEWWKDMAELMRLAEKLLYEQGYEVSPYTVNEHQVARDTQSPQRRNDG